MHTRRLLTLVGVAFAAPALTPMIAQADGMPTRPDPYAYVAPALAIPYDWTGIYVGGHAGVATAQWNWQFTNPTEQIEQRQTSFAGGAQAGIQKQWGQGLIGAEVSYTWADLGATSGSVAVLGNSRSSEFNNLLMATGRVGATWENFLAYFKGGYASADIGFRSELSGSGVVTTSSSAREQGWVAGLGLEYAIGDAVIIGIEYDYIHVNAPVRDQIATAAGTPGSRSSGGIDVQAVVARLSYKFGLFGLHGDPPPIK